MYLTSVCLSPGLRRRAELSRASSGAGRTPGSSSGSPAVQPASSCQQHLAVKAQSDSDAICALLPLIQNLFPTPSQGSS